METFDFLRITAFFFAVLSKYCIFGYTTLLLVLAVKYLRHSLQFSSVAQSCPTLRPHGLQHSRPPCPSPTPGVHRISDAIQPSHPLSSPSPPALNLSASGSFQMSQLFTSGGQSIGVSASTSVPKDRFLLPF